MAEKRYIITADTSQALKSLNKFADVFKHIGELPESFHKNVYNAFNSALKDINKVGNDTKKLGTVFNNLGQTIQKNLDFLNKDTLSKEVYGRFKELANYANEASYGLSRLDNQMTTLKKSTGMLNVDMSKFVIDLQRVNSEANKTKTDVKTVSSSLITLGNSAVKTATEMNKVSIDTEKFKTVVTGLSSQINNVTNSINGLSNKAKNAKTNLAIISGGLVQLKDAVKQIEQLSIDVKGLEKAKTSIDNLKNRYVDTIKAINSNKQALSELQSIYDKNSKQLDSYSSKYTKLKQEMDKIKSSGGNVPDNLSSNYEKLSSLIKSSSDRMNELKRSITSANTEQEKLVSTATLLKNAISRNANEYKAYSEQIPILRTLVGDLQSQSRAANEAAINAKTLNTELSKQNGILRLVGTQFRSLIYDLNAVRIAFVLLSSSTGIASAISVIADFDKSMARVKSLMIGAKEETGALNVEFQALSDVVMALGATTKFTAGQVAEGAVIITQAGYNAKESIDVLRPTLDLAVAGQIDMAEAADTLTKTISMFQKETTDAAHVADIYAAAVNYSQTNMSELANAMTYVGPVAETFGLTLEETAGYLAVLANNGVNASKAGTSLRQLMMNIQQPTAKAAQVLNAYGLNLKELQRQGMSSEEALRHILTTLSEVGRLGSVVRVTALPAAEILGKSGEDVEKMLKDLKEVDDYAKKVAENNMNNLKDQFIQLVSAIQDTIIKFGEFTGGTDALTSALKNGADAIRIWNVDMADLITDLMLAGGVLLALRGRWKNYQQAVKDAKNGQVQYNGILGKAENAFTSFKGKLTQVNDSIYKYRQSIQGATLATKTFNTVAKVASLPIVAMAGEMVALTAVMWGVSKAVEYFTSSNDINSILEENRDLFKAAAKGGKEYENALRAIAAAAQQMSEVQLAGKIEETSNEIEIVKKNLISSIKDIQSELSDIRRKALESAGGYEMVGASRFLSITDEQFDIIMETTSTQLPILDNLIQAVRNGASEEEIAGIMADLDPNAIEKLSSMLGVKGLNISLGNIDKTTQDMKALKDELRAMQGEMENKAIDKFKVDLSDILDKLTLIRELSKTNLTEVFAGAGAGSANKILELDKFIPVDSFRNIYNEILKIENGGKDLANVLDFSQEKGFFFNKGDLEAELEVLRKQLADYKELAMFYERINDEGRAAESSAYYEKLKKTITILESYGTELDNLNQSAFQENFLKIWQDASEKVNTDNLEKIAESIFKVTEASNDFRENFAKNMGVDFLNIGKQMGLLNEGDISLGRTFEDIRIDSQPVYDYINAMKEKIAVDLEAGRISELQYDNALRYLKVLPDLMKASYDKSQGRNRRKREDDFKLIYLQSEVAIGNATDALNGYNEQLLKTYELEKRMKDLAERNPKETSEWYGKAMESLKAQQAIIEAQMKAMAYYEKQSKSMADTGKLWGAMGIDSSALEVGNKYISMLEKQRALETAKNDNLLKNNKAIIEDMTKQYELEQQLYSIENQRYMLTKQSQIASMKKENNQMSSGGWLQNQRDWKYTKEQFNAEIEMVNQQIVEVANKITNLAGQTNLSIIESGEMERLKLLREELELRKENLELQKQMNDPGGFEGAKQAFREYAQTVGNDATLMKDAITQSLDTISSNLTEGLYAAMKQTEFDWENFWDSLAKIFLQKALEMTLMRGTAALFNTIFGAISSGLSSLAGGLSGGLSGGGLNSAGAFGGGGIAFAAKGRVINSPTYLMDKGQTVMAGERGAEAIMPLTRLSSGELGIKSTGTNGNANYNNNDFSIHITTTGSSGNAEQDRKQALEMQKMVKLLVNQQIGEFNKREHRQGGMFYNKR